MIAILALILGLVLGLFLNLSFPPLMAPFVAVLLLWLLYHLSLAVVLSLEEGLEPKHFWVHLLGDLLVALLITGLGERLSLPLVQAVYFAFGYRIFRVLSRLWARVAEDWLGSPSK